MTKCLPNLATYAIDLAFGQPKALFAFSAASVDEHVHVPSVGGQDATC